MYVCLGTTRLDKQDPLTVLGFRAGLPRLGAPHQPGLGQAGQAVGLAGAHAALQGVHQVLLHGQLVTRAVRWAAGLHMWARQGLLAVYTGQSAQGRAGQGPLAVYTVCQFA